MHIGPEETNVTLSSPLFIRSERCLRLQPSILEHLLRPISKLHVCRLLTSHYLQRPWAIIWLRREQNVPRFLRCCTNITKLLIGYEAAGPKAAAIFQLHLALSPRCAFHHLLSNEQGHRQTCDVASGFCLRPWLESYECNHQWATNGLSRLAHKGRASAPGGASTSDPSVMNIRRFRVV